MVRRAEPSEMHSALVESRKLQKEYVQQGDIISALTALSRQDSAYTEMADAFKALSAEIRAKELLRRSAVDVVTQYLRIAQTLLGDATNNRMKSLIADGVATEDDITDIVDDNKWMSFTNRLTEKTDVEVIRATRRAYGIAVKSEENFEQKVAKLKSRETMMSGSTEAETHAAKALVMRAQGVLDTIRMRKDFIVQVNLRYAAKLEKFVKDYRIPAKPKRELTDEEINAINAINSI